MKQIRFEDNGQNPLKIRKVKKLVKKLSPFVLVIGLLTALAVFLVTLASSSTVVNFNLLGNSLKSTDNKVNILFLGTAGGTYDGADLTDTIMIASYNLKTDQVYLISIPRDLWLPELRGKANVVYQMGLPQKNGLNLAKTIMGNILGVPIHYALRIDFRGFVQAIDQLGGIDVMVDNVFDDYNFPIAGKERDLCGYEEKEIDFSAEEAKTLNIDSGKRKVFVSPEGKIATDSAKEDMGAKYFSCRYEHLSFRQGLQYMDGETALKFVRSRHGTRGEASDFARSKRQEKVLQAVRNKIFAPDTLFNIPKITELIKTFDQSIDTDIQPRDGFELYKLSQKLEQTSSFILDDSPKLGLPSNRQSLLVHPPASDYGGAYVLVSQDDDFSIIAGYVKKILLGEIESETSSSARVGNK